MYICVVVVCVFGKKKSVLVLLKAERKFSFARAFSLREKTHSNKDDLLKREHSSELESKFASYRRSTVRHRHDGGDEERLISNLRG